IWRGAAVFVLVWLGGAPPRPGDARLFVAGGGLPRARARSDGGVRGPPGAPLGGVSPRGARTRGLAAGAGAAVEDELRALVEGSRRALAQARRTIRGYQRPSLRAELDSAAALLTAAGIQTRLELPRGALPDTVDAAARSALRAAVAALLRNDGARR